MRAALASENATAQNLARINNTNKVSNKAETGSGVAPVLPLRLCELLQQIVDERQNRLQHSEYDQTTWSARTWRSFAVQRLSVAVHKAAAMEVVRALALTTAYDTRAADCRTAFDVA